MKRTRKEWFLTMAALGLTGYFWVNSYESVYAMHISEGFLPLWWAVIWWILYLPFLILGIRAVRKRVEEEPEIKMLLGLSAAFAFVLSALKLPSITGSSSHPTGTGLGTVLFGPLTMSVIGFAVLLFQALLLAHGGLTTLGANALSMAVAGPMIAYAILVLGKKLGISYRVSIFLAAFLGDIMTYFVTSFQLALAFPAETGGIFASFLSFAGIFMVTQIPLAASEGLLTVVVLNLLMKYNVQELSLLKLPIGVRTKHE